MSKDEALAVFARFRKLEPPFSATRARHVLGRTQWLDKSDVDLKSDIVGDVPINLMEGGKCFSIFLTQPKGLRPGYSVWLRTTNDLSSMEALRRFLRGQAPRSARVLEYALVHNALWPTYKIEHHDSGTKEVPGYAVAPVEPDVPADFLPAQGTLAEVLQTPMNGSFEDEPAGMVVGKLCDQLPANSFYKANTAGQPHPMFTGGFRAVPLRTALYRIAQQSHLKIEWIEEPNGNKTISASE